MITVTVTCYFGYCQQYVRGWGWNQFKIRA